LPVIELAGEINSKHAVLYVVNELAIALDRQQKQGFNGSRILLIGIAYKKNIDDILESPALALMELLRSQRSGCRFP
jgi:UDP-N-acetyl-D-glucosamine dehydrogenase